MEGLLLIISPVASQGFRLGGFETREVDDKTDMDALMEGVLGEGRYGLVCIEERFMEKVSERVIRRVRKKGLPVIIPIDIPGRWEKGAMEESHIARLIRRAVGYQIKIKR